MAIKVGINGFGRIGRLVFRAGLDNPNIEFVGVNDPFMTPDYCAYMLRYDTIHGQYTGEVSYTDDAIIVNGKTVKFYAEREPANIPWALAAPSMWLSPPAFSPPWTRLRPTSRPGRQKGHHLRALQ